MVRLLAFPFFAFLALIIAIAAARAAGQARAAPQSVSQLRLLDCTPPCWIGIVPGLSTVKEAKAKIVAAFTEQSQMQIKDTAGFPGGYASAKTIDNTIESHNFYLFVRLSISELVDAKSETVQSISLLEPRSDNMNYAPTVADVLGSFGPPQWVVVHELAGSGYEITLKYEGLDVAFYTHAGRSALTENPRFHLANQDEQNPSAEYHHWKGFGSLMPGN
jgi:hypothetical protein